MNLKELINLYKNIDKVSITDFYSVHVMYCKIVYTKPNLQDYNLKDIKNYCKWVYLLKESEKMKDELKTLTSYGRNEQLIPVLEKIENIFEKSYEEVNRLSEAINCYEHEIEPIKDGIEDLFE